MESEESHNLADESTGNEGPESSEFEINGEQYVALKKSDFVQYEETVELAHQMMLDCVERIFKAFKAIPRQPVTPPLPKDDK